MNGNMHRHGLILLVLSILLAACGTFSVQIEPPASPGSTHAPPSISPSIPSSTYTPPPAPSATPFPGKLHPGQAVTIIKIDMMNPMEGWAVGQVESDLNDHILFTMDGAQTWTDRTPMAILSSASADGLKAVSFFGSVSNAWVAYAGSQLESSQVDKPVVWHTQDGGVTWESGELLDLSGIPVEFYVLSNLSFLDEQHGWIMVHLGAGMSHDYVAAFITSDGGHSWSRVLDPLKDSGLMSCSKTGLAFSSETTGWLSGNCPGLMPYLFLYRTTDNGKTWDQIALYPPEGQPGDLFETQGCGIPDLIYTSPRSIILDVRCSDYSTNKANAWLYASEDGGLTWSARPLPVAIGMFDFASPDQGWMVGTNQEGAPDVGEFYDTNDGGHNWTAITLTGWEGIPDFVSPDTGWVVARHEDVNALEYTLNGGQDWAEIKPIMDR